MRAESSGRVPPVPRTLPASVPVWFKNYEYCYNRCDRHGRAKIFGATEGKKFPCAGVRFFVSAKNKGKTQVFKDQTLQLESLSDKTNLKNIDIAFFQQGRILAKSGHPVLLRQGLL